MANITLDFLHNYHTGERRESDPAYAYQYDEGHVLEAVLPSVVTTVELHYWIRGMEEAEAYTPTSITPNDENSCTVLGNIPNKYFETNGELRIYIVVNDASASITTYEGKLNICQRSKPDDYVDDDPENEATRVLTEARAAAATATAAAETAQDVADSIPADYTQLSEDVSQLKEEITDIIDSAYVTDTASGSIASFQDGANGVPVKSLKVNIEPVQSGSGDPSPTNVRPISGHTSAVVTRTGKNLYVGSPSFDGYSNRERYQNESETYNGHEVISRSTSYNGAFYPIMVTGGKTYTFSAMVKCGANTDVNIYEKTTPGGSSKSFRVGTEWQKISLTITPNADGEVQLRVESTTNTKIYLSEYQLEVGSEATAYEPYTAQNVTVDLDGTRYGGTLDVGTGVLTVTYVFAMLNGSESWLVNSATSGLYYIAVTNMNGSGRLYSDRYVQTTVPGASMTDGQMKGVNPNIINFKTSYATVDEWKTALASDNVQLLYELETPFTVQLTANEISTLLGQNNIWSDAGTVDVEYRADTKLYIQKVMSS